VEHSTAARSRLIVLTDIARGLEIDDIQSMVRLLLYADVIDVEGLIATTSSWHKTSRPRGLRIIHRIVNAYAAVKP
jgi:glycerol-3-phosphate responsive antiterminator